MIGISRPTIYKVLKNELGYLSNRLKQMMLNKLSFESESLVVDWIAFNLEGLMDPRIIAGRLSKYFTPHVLIDDERGIEFHGFRKRY